MRVNAAYVWLWYLAIKLELTEIRNENCSWINICIRIGNRILINRTCDGYNTGNVETRKCIMETRWTRDTLWPIRWHLVNNITCIYLLSPNVIIYHHHSASAVNFIKIWIVLRAYSILRVLSYIYLYTNMNVNRLVNKIMNHFNTMIGTMNKHNMIKSFCL